jgi:inhibitor of cysteine peptidase
LFSEVSVSSMDAAPLILLLTLTSAQGCTRGTAMIKLDEAAAGRPITAKVGQRLEITLPENRTTGYRWKVVNTCQSILRPEEDRLIATAGTPGAGSDRVWVFAAYGEGHCELRLEYARSWESTVTGKSLSFPITVSK